MQSSKPWYASTGVWGSLMSIVASLLAWLHFHPDPQWQSDAVGWITQAATLVGGALALWGRLRATKQIGSPSTTPGNLTRLFALCVLCVSAVMTTGCSFFQAPAGAYVAADRQTHDAIAPEYQAYVHADPKLTPDQVSRRDRTLQSWELRIEQAEAKANSAAPTPAAVPATQPTTAPSGN